MDNLERLKWIEEHKKKFSKEEYIKTTYFLQRELCKENLAYLVTEVLDPDYYKPILAPFHYEMMKFAEGEGNRKLILVPRGHLKSSLVTIPLVVRRLLVNPDARILLTNATLDNSQKFLRSIKGYFEGCEKLKYLFGEFKSEKWNETEIVIKQRKKLQIKESSVIASSVEKGIVSQHFDMIIADDLVNRESVNTKDQMDKTLMYYRDLLDLIEPEETVVCIGTRWHFDDLYDTLLKDGGYKVYFKTVYENGEVIFPMKFNKEYLERLRIEKTEAEFSAQYLNTPIDEKNAPFKEAWLRNYYDELPDDVYNYFLTLDTAGGGEGKNSDANGWIMNAVNSKGEWYILEAIADKVNPTEIIDRLFAFNSRYPALKIGIEKTMYTNAFKPQLEAEQRKRGEYLQIEEIKNNITSKEARIKSLIPRFQNKMIFLRKEFDNLRSELLRFPKSRHDDISDALAMQMQIAIAPSGREEAETEEIISNRQNYEEREFY